MADDADEPLHLPILAVLAKADRPLDADELAERSTTATAGRSEANYATAS